MPSAIHRVQYELFRSLLQEARERAGLTQVQLAELIGKPQSFVSKCERGERRVDVTEFVEIADALGIDLASFVADYRERLSARLSLQPKRARGVKGSRR